MVTDLLRRRADTPRRGFATYHARTIRNTRYESIIHASADLEKRVRKIERFIGWIQDLSLGLISSAVAFGVVMCFGGGSLWTEAITSAILGFLITTWMASSFFRTLAEQRH
jgi:uncharacterized membrane protein YeaQ/YmgE (transglycosylase-associated protein family)